MAGPESVTEIGRLPLVEEVPRIIRRRRVTGGVRVSVTTTEAPGEVHTTRRRRMVEVERVALDQEVETPPPVRQEGDLVVVPVLEERLVVVRRLFVTEEIRFRIAVEEEAVTLSLPLARQEVSVTRLPPPEVTSTSDDSMNRGDPLMQRTLTAMFDSRAEAERAAETLRGLGIGAQNIRMHQADAGSGQAGTTGTGSTTTGTTGTPREDRGILGAIADLFMPDDDRATYSEGLRRGATLVLAEVDEARMHQAMDAMEAAGAVDLDEREADWRQQGWSGGSMAGVSSGSVESSMVMPDTDTRTGVDTGIPAHGSTGTGSTGIGSTGIGGVVTGGEHSAYGATAAGGGHSAATGTTTGTTGGTLGHSHATAQDLHGEQRIPMAEERLRVGKRESHAGRVRVRSYVVETPVEEQVTLREEHVNVQRVPADRAATASEANLFQDRVIEAEESTEEAVVQKDVRVTGEVVVNKETTEHTETVRDTVRRTEVDVDENAAANDPTRTGRTGRTG